MKDNKILIVKLGLLGVEGGDWSGMFRYIADRPQRLALVDAWAAAAVFS